jgi:hypothetical protein
MGAVNRHPGTADWVDKLPSSPYGTGTMTYNFVFSTTYNGNLCPFRVTILIPHTMPLAAGTNVRSPLTGDYVMAGAALPGSSTRPSAIIVYRLGATGKVTATAGS